MKYQRFLSPITYTTLFSFILMTAGCYTTKIQNVEEEKVPALKGEYAIITIYTKKGEVIKLTDNTEPRFPEFGDSVNVTTFTDPKFYSKFGDSVNVITFTETKYFTSGEKHGMTITNRMIPLKEISFIKIERSKFHLGQTILLTAGIVAVIALIVFIIAAASFHLDFGGPMGGFE